jgi:hypothetical protein
LAEISDRDNHQQYGHTKRREDIEERRLLEINQQKDQQGQSENPQVRNRAAFVGLSSYSLTHYSLSLSSKKKAGSHQPLLVQFVARLQRVISLRH